MGCVPVVISEVQELAFEEFLDWDSLAIWVRPSDITDLDTILKSISDEEIVRRREAMRRFWRVLWYHGEEGLAYEGILQALDARKTMNKPRRHFVTVQESLSTTSTTLKT